MSSIRSHLKHHSGAAIIGGVAQLTAITIIAARFGTVAFGKLAIFMSFAQVFTFFTTLNLAGYSVSIASPIKRLRFAATLTTGSFIISSIALISLIIYRIFCGKSLIDPEILMPIYLLIQAISSIVFSLHIASGRTPQAAISYIVRPFSLLLFTVILSLITKEVWVLIVGLVFSEFTAAALLLWTLPKREKWLAMRVSIRIWYDNWRKEYKFYLSAGFGAYLSNLAASLPILYGGHLMSPKLLGHFALAQRLTQAPIIMIAAPVCAIVNRSARQRQETGQAIDGFIKMVFVAALAIGSCIFVSLLIAISLVQGHLPSDWNGLNDTAPFVFVAGIFQFATSTIGFAPLLLRRVKFLIAWSVARVSMFSFIVFLIYYAKGSVLFFLIGFMVNEILMSTIFCIYSANTKSGRLKV